MEKFKCMLMNRHRFESTALRGLPVFPNNVTKSLCGKLMSILVILNVRSYPATYCNAGTHSHSLPLLFVVKWW